MAHADGAINMADINKIKNEIGIFGIIGIKGIK